MTDEDLDRQLHEWGRAERDRAPAIAVPALAEPHRSRARLLTAAAVLLVFALAGIVLLVRSRSDSSDQATSGPSSNTAYSPETGRLVLHDGDTVTASGNVVSVPGKPVRFCDPNVAERGSGSSDPTANFANCSIGIDVSGVDLSKLTHRRELNGQVVGGATLTGVYRNQTITVTQQGPAAREQPLLFNDDHPPCVAPSGGWPHGRADANLPFGPVERYKRTHRDAIVFEATLRPSATQALIYLVTSGDPAPVRDALTATYGQRLCVIKSRYTNQQIETAYHAVTDPMGGRPSLTTPTGAGGPTLNPMTIQPMVEADVPVLSQSLADAIDAQPAGLVQVTVWLAPHR